MTNQHEGDQKSKTLGVFFEKIMLKSYKKPFIRNVEVGTYIANHNGIKLNSKSEWHQPQIVRTKTLGDIASLRINLSLKTVQLSPPMFGQFSE